MNNTTMKSIRFSPIKTGDPPKRRTRRLAIDTSAFPKLVSSSTSNITFSPREPGLKIETTAFPKLSPRKTGLKIDTTAFPKFSPRKTGLKIDTTEFKPKTSGLRIQTPSPPRYEIPMGTSPPIQPINISALSPQGNLGSLSALSPQGNLGSLSGLSPNEDLITPASKRDEIKKYTKIFKRMSMIGDKEIIVVNPKNHREKIPLYKLFHNISTSLLTIGEYAFKDGYSTTIPIPQVGKIPRKYDGIHNISNNMYEGNAYNVTSNAYHAGSDEFIKQTCLSMFKKDYVNGFVSIVHETCLLYYARELNRTRHLFKEEEKRGEKLVVIPEIYKVELEPQDGIDCMKIYMEKIETQPKTPMQKEKSFKKWDGITTQIFQYFREHNLAHLDTNPNNVFHTTDKKLAIIDFGESILPDTEINLRQAKPTGYLKTGNTIDTYNEWLNGRKTKDNGMEIFHDHEDYWGGGSLEQSRRLRKTRKHRNKTRLAPK